MEIIKNTKMEKSTLAPIVLFAYNRLDHTRRTIEALKQNALANDSDLIIFSDAAKLEAQAKKVCEVRQYIQHINGFRSVTVIERERNLGLAKSIIDGVSKIVGEQGRIIVLEDDMVTSPFFLTYMNEALEKYANDDRIVSIHGWLFPTENALPETFFLLGTDCWGWATWHRGWKVFNSDGQFLLNELKRRKLTRTFDYNGAYPYIKMLRGQIEGKNDSWAVRWYASAFLAEKLTLYPGRSLVHNIGNDNSGTHCGETEHFDTELSGTPITLGDIEVGISEVGKNAFEDFLRQSQGKISQRLISKVLALMGIWK